MAGKARAIDITAVVMRHAQEFGYVTARGCAALNHITVRYARSILAELVRLGHLTASRNPAGGTTGSNPTIYRRAY